MARSRKFEDLLIESLKDPKEAIAYLNTILDECKSDDDESQKLLLIGLKNVAMAQGGIAKVAEKASLGRESLYKTLSQKGNPKLTTLARIAGAMGFELQFHLSKR